MGTPSAQTLDDVGVREIFQKLEEVPLMTMVGGLDVHLAQITFDYVDDDGLVHWGQIRAATRKTLRGWLAEHCPDGDAEFALEGCTGWRYVSEELAGAGVGGQLGDPAEIAVLRGPKKRAKTDRADARLLRTLLFDQGCPRVGGLLSGTGCAALAGAALSGVGGQYVDSALGRIDEASTEI